jgi:hypothetical protein
MAWRTKPEIGLVLIVAFGAAALTTLVSVLLVLTPRLVRQWKPGLVYFGDVARQAYEQWQQQMLALSPNALSREVLEQVYATAYIADRKHKYVRQAIRSLLITVLLGLVLYVLSQVAP